MQEVGKMASPTYDVATGITVAFGTSGFTANIVNITGPSWTRPVFDISHQGTTGHITKVGADLADPGELVLHCQFNPDTDVPSYGGDTEELTITWPSGATWVVDGIISGYPPAADLNAIMTVDVTVSLSGGITITAG